MTREEILEEIHELEEHNFMLNMSDFLSDSNRETMNKNWNRIMELKRMLED